jgi:hypothetical protein
MRLSPTIGLLCLLVPACADDPEVSGDDDPEDAGDDAGAAIGCPAVRLTDDVIPSYRPSLAWTGSEYGLAWQEGDLGDEVIQFLRLDTAGHPIGDPVVIDPGRRPTLLWSGAEYAIVWEGEDTVEFALLDADGSSTVRRSFTGSSPAMVWNGFEYGIAYLVGATYPERADVFLHWFGANGVDRGDRQISTSANGCTTPPCSAESPAVAWHEGSYGVAWRDPRDGAEGLYFAGYDRLTEVATEVLVDPDGEAPALASDPGGLVMTWTAGDQIWFERFETTGTSLGAALEVSPVTPYTTRSVVAWNGASHGVVWHVLAGPDSRIELAEVSDAVAGPVSTVGAAVELAAGPSMVWNGSSFAVAWSGLPYGAPDLYFAFAPCGS